MLAGLALYLVSLSTPLDMEPAMRPHVSLSPVMVDISDESERYREGDRVAVNGRVEHSKGRR